MRSVLSSTVDRLVAFHEVGSRSGESMATLPDNVRSVGTAVANAVRSGGPGVPDSLRTDQERFAAVAGEHHVDPVRPPDPSREWQASVGVAVVVVGNGS